MVSGPIYSSATAIYTSNDQLFTLSSSGHNTSRSSWTQVIFNIDCSIIITYSTITRGTQTNASTKITLNNDTSYFTTSSLAPTTLEITQGDILKCTSTMSNVTTSNGLRTVAISIAVS